MADYNPDVHRKIPVDQNGRPINHKYDPDANGGDGGFVLIGKNDPMEVKQTGDVATETTLDTKLSNLEDKMDTLLNSQDTDNNLNVKQTGRYVALENDDLVDKNEPEIRLLSTDTKPDASTVELYQIALEMDTGYMYYSDGTNWVVFD